MRVHISQVRPIEEAFKFAHFFSPFMTESDFDAKPSILLLGQYSTGKVWNVWGGTSPIGEYLQYTCGHCFGGAVNRVPPPLSPLRRPSLRVCSAVTTPAHTSARSPPRTVSSSCTMAWRSAACQAIHWRYRRTCRTRACPASGPASSAGVGKCGRCERIAQGGG